jgi:hypothetical protein
MKDLCSKTERVYAETSPSNLRWQFGLREIFS